MKFSLAQIYQSLQEFLAHPYYYRISHQSTMIEYLSTNSVYSNEHSIFVLLNQHNITYALDALAKKSYVLINASGFSAHLTQLKPYQDQLIIVQDKPSIYQIYAHLSSWWFNLAAHHPNLHLSALTGTNGKSSTVDFYIQLLNFLQIEAASIGTLGVNLNQIAQQHPPQNFSADLATSTTKPSTTNMTTPDSFNLQKTINQLTQHSINYIALEASSHGISQHRLDGLNFASVVFTNFSQDHLDYHHNMEDYWLAKQRLFDELAGPSTTLIINLNDPRAECLLQIAHQRQLPIITYFNSLKTTTQPNNQLSLLAKLSEQKIILHQYQYCPASQKFKVCLAINKQIIEFSTSLFGVFQMENLMAALGMLMVSRPAQFHLALDFLEQIHAPKGRMQMISLAQNALAIIDYAHTEDALYNILYNIRNALPQAKILLVFGCGGNRDQSKRPLMGKIAAQYSDFTIITSDNPRQESLSEINQQILEGFCTIKNHHYLVIEDRQQAIQQALLKRAEYGVIVVAGKGHETYQIFDQEIHHFDDEEIIHNLMKNF